LTRDLLISWRLVKDFTVEASVEARLGDGMIHVVLAIGSYEPGLRILVQRLHIESVEFWKFFKVNTALSIALLVLVRSDLLHIDSA